jgi:hypothetical protein
MSVFLKFFNIVVTADILSPINTDFTEFVNVLNLNSDPKILNDFNIVQYIPDTYNENYQRIFNHDFTSSESYNKHLIELENKKIISTHSFDQSKLIIKKDTFDIWLKHMEHVVANYPPLKDFVCLLKSLGYDYLSNNKKLGQVIFNCINIGDRTNLLYYSLNFNNMEIEYVTTTISVNHNIICKI